MAKENKKLLSEERTDHVLHDNSGREIHRLSFIRTEQEDEDGTEYYNTIVDSFEGGDGSQVSYGDISRPQSQGGIALKRCSWCQRESRRLLFRQNTIIPFSPASQMRNCFFCRTPLCSRHYYVFQNHIVCKSCRRKQFFLKRILRPIFFKRVQEV